MDSKQAKYFSSPKFRAAYHYAGSDLGVTRTAKSTKYRVWAPTADAVKLQLYADGLDGEALRVVNMKKAEKGTWVATVKGDWKNTFYTYRTTVAGVQQGEAVDPYALAVGVNGRRGMVVDLAETNPKSWQKDTKPAFEHPTDAVIYELHVRDFSIHPDSGMKNKGLFLAFTEKGTKTKRGVTTGISHLVELGVTHVHLLPIQDFHTVDEEHPEKNHYNWGYDPQNYNAPEGSFSSNPYDGRVRIREFKQLVMALHAAGIRVVMDVVYNHTYKALDSHFNQLVPGYYYRQDGKGGLSNGSGCGNETASDRSMFRKYIVDSVAYWAREYHVDGFRFDLMGLHDIETMNQVRAAVDQIDPSILVYGEGWTGGESPLPEKKRAIKANAAKLKRIAVFSDDIRDGAKGPVWDKNQVGFVGGMKDREETIKFSVAAATKHSQVNYEKVWYSKKPWAAEPHHTINYVSVHDNHTLWDKLCICAAKSSEVERIRMNMLSDAIVLTSQGIPLFHAGAEFLRTKGGEENSYNKPDSVNQLDWNRKAKYSRVVAYYKGLIALRKARPALRLRSAAAIRKHLSFLNMPVKGMVGFKVSGHANGDAAETVVVVYNATKRPRTVSLPAKGWKLLALGEKASGTPFENVRGSRVKIPAVSALVAISN